MFKEMGEDLDKKIVEYKQQIEDYKTKLDFDGLVEKYKQEQKCRYSNRIGVEFEFEFLF